MIRWTFYFNDGKVESETRSEEEDTRLFDWIEKEFTYHGDTLYLPCDNSDMWLSPAHIKAITREIVTEGENTQKTPEAA